MKAVILAAGEGKRLKPFTEAMPKVMLPICNKPILEYVVDACKSSGISEIIVVVGYKKEVIMEYFKDYKGVKITYVVQEKQLGTAHALLQAKKHIRNTFIVLSGDNIIDKNSISKLINDKSKNSILVKDHPHPSKYGVVSEEKNIVKEIIEKPKEEYGRLISTGIYKLSNNIFKILEESTSQGIYALSNVVQYTIDAGETIKTISADLWMDIVYPWDLINVNESMIKNIKTSTAGTIEKGVTIKGKVKIGKNTTIRAGCYIVGPVVIGEGCEIGPNTCIFPSTSIGDNTVIRPSSEIRDSVIMNNVHIGSNSFITHSIIGRGNSIRNNFSTMSGKTVVNIDKEYKELGDMGVMIGEDCVIESHVVIQPGITIGRMCEIESMKKITKNVLSKSKVM